MSSLFTKELFERDYLCSRGAADDERCASDLKAARSNPCATWPTDFVSGSDTSRRLRGLTGSASDHRSLPPEFDSRRGHV